LIFFFPESFGTAFPPAMGKAAAERSDEQRNREGNPMNRIARLAIMCMLLIAALAIIWNLLSHP
jgi:hypothetical protein